MGVVRAAGGMIGAALGVALWAASGATAAGPLCQVGATLANSGPGTVVVTVRVEAGENPVTAARVDFGDGTQQTVQLGVTEITHVYRHLNRPVDVYVTCIDDKRGTGEAYASGGFRKGPLIQALPALPTKTKCRGTSTVRLPAGDIRVWSSIAVGTHYIGYPRPANQIITKPSQLASWAGIIWDDDLARLRRVDFATNAVVAVLNGDDQSNRTLYPTSLQRTKTGLLVRARRPTPMPGNFATTQGSPYMFIVVPRDALGCNTKLKPTLVVSDG